MLLLPSSLPCVSVVWGCLLYRSPLPTIPPPFPPPPARLCTVLLCGSVVCFVPPPRKLWNPHLPCALVPGLLVGWLLVFGLLGWLLCWLVGCWLLGSGTAGFGWLAGWLLGWLVCWLVSSLVGRLLASFWGVCVCSVLTHVVLLHSVSPCKHARAAIARVFGGVVHISFRRSSGVLARCSSGVLGTEAAPLERC